MIYTHAFRNHNPDGAARHHRRLGGPDKLTLYEPRRASSAIASAWPTLLGLAPENVRVISLYLGGGFGSKGPSWSHIVLCRDGRASSEASGEAGAAASADVRPGRLPLADAPNYRGWARSATAR